MVNIVVIENCCLKYFPNLNFKKRQTNGIQMPFFSLNLLVLLCGLALAGLGVWLVAEEHFYLGTGNTIIKILPRPFRSSSLLLTLSLPLKTKTRAPMNTFLSQNRCGHWPTSCYHHYRCMAHLLLHCYLLSSQSTKMFKIFYDVQNLPKVVAKCTLCNRVNIITVERFINSK